MTWSRKIKEQAEVSGFGRLTIYTFAGVLADIPAEDYCRNIELTDREGRAIWRIARAPHGDHTDTYVGVFVKEGFVEVIGFNGMAYDLDMSSGKVSIKDWRG